MTNENIPVPPVLVLGVGNILMKDEGVGAHAAQKLLQIPLPAAVEVIDGGTFGIDLLGYLENREKVILIDAIDTDEPPGTIFRLRPEDIHSLSKGEHYSLHQPGISDVIRFAEMIGQEVPEIIIFAIQPAEIAMGTELTPVMKEKMPELIDFVLKEIEESSPHAQTDV